MRWEKKQARRIYVNKIAEKNDAEYEQILNDKFELNGLKWSIFIYEQIRSIFLTVSLIFTIKSKKKKVFLIEKAWDMNNKLIAIASYAYYLLI